MAQCVHSRPDGDRCHAQAMSDSLFCYQHDPDPGLAEERQLNRVKGGKTGGRGRPKGGREISWVKEQLKTVTEQVLNGQIETKVGAVAAQLLTAYRQAVETELRIIEMTELEESLRILEARASL